MAWQATQRDDHLIDPSVGFYNIEGCHDYGHALGFRHPRMYCTIQVCLKTLPSMLQMESTELSVG